MQTALVTGTSSGLGRGVAAQLHSLGWEVLGTVRDPSASAGLAFDTVQLDVTDDDGVAELGERIMSKWGHLDVLVNNAGRLLNGPIEELRPSELREQLNVNVVGAAALTRALLPALRAAGGTVIQVSSIAGQIGFSLFGAYNAAKFALEGLSEALSAEVNDQGVRVVLIEPSAFRTAISSKGAFVGDRGATGHYAEGWREQDEWHEWLNTEASPDAGACVDAIVAAATRGDVPMRVAVGERTADRIREHARLVLAQMDESELFLRSAAQGAPPRD
jgi:NAD(P)-dependent dehydrogenase (short-subunit alcohol dehydrogenase family)